MVVVAMQGTAMFRAVTSPRESEVTLQENHNYPIMKGAFIAVQSQQFGRKGRSKGAEEAVHKFLGIFW